MDAPYNVCHNSLYWKMLEDDPFCQREHIIFDNVVKEINVGLVHKSQRADVEP